ncbi:MAG TPA: hypothetical protein VNN72_21560 [Polyangiaceae bacterium]|nr:hypothetical protein [Polyangiaceae bacterium]
MGSPEPVAASAESDLDALAIPFDVKLAGGVMALGGAFFVVTGLQALGLTMRGLLNAVGPLAIAVGVSNVVVGAGVARARFGAARVGVVLAGATSLLALSWAGFALMNGVLSLIAVSVIPISGLAALLVFMALKSVKKIDGARERLRSQGLDGGF